MDEMRRIDEQEGHVPENLLEGIYETHRKAHIERMARLILQDVLKDVVAKADV